MIAPRRPSLILHTGGGYSWAWPDDPANRAEDERIAEIYHQERMKKKALYDAKRAEYLAAVAAGLLADPVRSCPVCGEAVYGGDEYCSPDCMSEGESRPLDVSHTVMGRPMGHYNAPTCPVCNRVLAGGDRGSAQKYCSRKCKNKATKRRGRGVPVKNKKRKIA